MEIWQFFTLRPHPNNEAKRRCWFFFLIVCRFHFVIRIWKLQSGLVYKMGFVRDEMNKHYELNRGVRRLLTRCGLHKFHWSWWGWFNFSCTKRERTNDWATRTRGFVMERECKSIFLGCAKKVKVLTTIINNIQLLCRESILTCSKMDWAILWSCDQTKVGVIQKHFTSAHVLS